MGGGQLPARDPLERRVRIDDAHRFFGLRLNDYVAVVVFLGATTYLVRTRGRGREEQVHDESAEPADDAAPRSLES